MFGDGSDDDEQRRRFTRRAALLGLGQLGAFGLIGTQLFRLQVLESSRYAPLAEENRINLQVLAPQRGRILDRNGEVLADNREAYRAVLTPALSDDVRRVVARFSEIVPIAGEMQERIVLRARRQPSHLPVVLAGDLDFEQIARINLMAPYLPGIRTEPDSRRRYFRGPTVAHVVGFVGASGRAALDDDPVVRVPGMRIGKSGVERGMDQLLRGRGGHVKHEVDARGRIIRELEHVEPAAGSDVVVTIDTGLQERAIERLSRERRAALVAMDVTNGEVLVMASVPGFDNASLARAEPQTAGPAVAARKLLTTANNPLVNRTIRGAYPPGSTFKMVTLLAALEAGVVTARDRITCEGRYEFANHTYRCWNKAGHGPCDLHRALRESCDVYFYDIARRTGIDAIARMARRLGLGQTYDCGIALQRAGVVPDADWKRMRLGRPWLGGETILAGIGQGYVLTTPLQLAVMTARLATGRAILPTLVRRQDESAALFPALADLRPEWLDAIRRAMQAVVHEPGGTASSARLEDANVRMAGKTGTSQVSRASTMKSQSELRWEERDHALFVAYAPANAPRYAIAAVVEHAGSGGQVAAPIVRDIMAELIKRDPSSRPAAPERGRS